MLALGLLIMSSVGVIPLYLSIFGRSISIECADTPSHYLLTAGYGHMAMPEPPRIADLHYAVGRGHSGHGYTISIEGQPTLHAADSGEFLFLFEKEMTIALERLCTHLYFLHAAALGYRDSAIVLVAPSGSGKSTMTWALLHHGFTYLSDELAPIDLDHLVVHPYGHALCLKNDPPAYPLPATTVRTPGTLHVPVCDLPSVAIGQSMPVRAVFFVSHTPGIQGPKIETVGVGISAARLVSNLLNSLAHTATGLDGAIRIARGSACFDMQTTDLHQTCLAVIETLDRI